MRKRILACAVLVAAVGLVGTAGPALAASTSTPTGGAIKVWVHPNHAGTTTTSKHPGKVMITGAIGDYGLAVNVNATGKPQQKKSPYKLLKLKHGTILVDASALNSSVTKTKPTVNSTNCSVSETATGGVSILKGTGKYTGVSGSVTITVNFAAVLPKTKSGSCTMKTATQPLSTYTSFIGTGTVSFS